jgi:hypothetical protein
MQGCTNPRHQVTVVTKFGKVFCNICGFAVMELAFYHPFAPGILRWLLDFWKIGALLYLYVHVYVLTGIKCLTLWLHVLFGRSGVLVSPWRAAVQTDIIHKLLQHLQTNARMCFIK